MQRFFLLLLASVSLLAGCAADPRLSHSTQYLTNNRGVFAASDPGRPDWDTVSNWDGDGVSGPPSIVINLTEQRAYFFKGGQLVGKATISTGREGFNTPVGTFRIIQKDKDHVSSRFGDYLDATTGAVIKKDADRNVDPLPKGAKFDGAKMPYFMRIVGGTGMHEGFLPGMPASHGCIRMPSSMAKKFFENVSVGTPVRIIQ